MTQPLRDANYARELATARLPSGTGCKPTSTRSSARADARIRANAPNLHRLSTEVGSEDPVWYPVEAMHRGGPSTGGIGRARGCGSWPRAGLKTSVAPANSTRSLLPAPRCWAKVSSDLRARV
jgi:hypothetical protein